MPELPEVETIARQLHPQVVGQRISKVQIIDQKLLALDAKQLLRRKIVAVRRIAKEVVFELAGIGNKNPESFLFVHLRMTGRLSFVADGERLEPRHLRACLTLDQGLLAFHDVRRFGTLKLKNHPEPSMCGVEPLSLAFDPQKLFELGQGSPQEVKPWLLRQDKIVGIGNIYASEALFRSGIDPRTPVASLSKPRLKRLHREIVTVLQAAIDHCGTTFSDYRDALGDSGAFQEFLTVYGRSDQPCRQCQTPIKRLVQQGRSTFYCDRCQKR